MADVNISAAKYQFVPNDTVKAKIEQIAVTKSVLRVVTQSPAPGTPLLAGMTVEVHAVAYSDVPWRDVDPNAPLALRDFNLEEVTLFAEHDEVLQKYFTPGTGPREGDPVDIANRFNTALAANGKTQRITAEDVPGIAASYGGAQAPRSQFELGGGLLAGDRIGSSLGGNIGAIIAAGGGRAVEP